MRHRATPEPMKTYTVTVINTVNGARETHVVSAEDEWKARTMAMFKVRMTLKGELVAYEVAEHPEYEPVPSDRPFEPRPFVDAYRVKKNR